MARRGVLAGVVALFLMMAMSSMVQSFVGSPNLRKDLRSSSEEIQMNFFDPGIEAGGVAQQSGEDLRDNSLRGASKGSESFAFGISALIFGLLFLKIAGGSA